MSLVWRSSCRTDVGKVRRLNEDGFVELPEIGVWLVADGMGGHAAGDVASGLIVESFEHLRTPGTVEELAYDVRIRLYEANRKIREHAQRRGPGATMGSTVVTFLARDRHCVCQWAGDSRAYLMRGGNLTQITRDHSAVEDLIEAGELRREDAADHPQANVITRAVGVAEQLMLDECVHEGEEGDTILLCSDGLNKELNDEEIAVIIDGHDYRDASRLLVETALHRGARDNVTVAVIESAAASDPTLVLDAGQ